MLDAGCGEVVDELDFVGGIQFLDGFDFYDEGIVDDEVCFELSDDVFVVVKLGVLFEFRN